MRSALEALGATRRTCVLIHDAARPDLPAAVIGRLLAALEQHARRHSGAAGGRQPRGRRMAGSWRRAAEREALRRVQTPQAFRFADILAAHRAWPERPRPATMRRSLRAAGLPVVAWSKATNACSKLTFAEDFVDTGSLPCLIRIGTGFDVHRLVEGEELWLCGVQIEHDKGWPAIAMPMSASRRGRCHARRVARRAISASTSRPAIRNGKARRRDGSSPMQSNWPTKSGYAIGNVDLTLICEAPKIGPHREAMRARLAELLGVAEGLSA